MVESKCARRELNLHKQLRRLLPYPLGYGRMLPLIYKLSSRKACASPTPFVGRALKFRSNLSLINTPGKRKNIRAAFAAKAKLLRLINHFSAINRCFDRADHFLADERRILGFRNDPFFLEDPFFIRINDRDVRILAFGEKMV